MDKKKIGYGQYYTSGDPFRCGPFREWAQMAIRPGTVLLEPFAGANSIVRMIRLGGWDNPWACFDIDPPSRKLMAGFPVLERDTLAFFPRGYRTAVTNPPFLYRSSARRKKIPFPDSAYDDLYKIALDTMLEHCRYVAAIVPESFITSGLFHERLWAFVSLTQPMFDSTDCPAGLALFTAPGAKDTEDFPVYRQDQLLGSYLKLAEKIPAAGRHIPWKFNDPCGEIGVRCIDSIREESIRFIPGADIPSASIKISSRSLTRISGLPENIPLDTFIDACNGILANYRCTTHDVFLTSFKGLRKDGLYRRRLDFAAARSIMDLAAEQIQKKGTISCPLPLHDPSACSFMQSL